MLKKLHSKQYDYSKQCSTSKITITITINVQHENYK